MEPVKALALPHPELDDPLSRACLRVEHYLSALRIRNKRIQHELTHAMLDRVRDRLMDDPKLVPEALVMDEIESHVSAWYARVTGREEPPERLGTSARMSFFNANLAGKWSVWFLREGPWPDEFIAAMREADLHAHPDAATDVRMTPRPLDLGTIGDMADETWRLFGKWPVLGGIAITLAYLGILALILLFTV